MRHNRYELEHYDEDTGSRIRAIVYVDTVPGFLAVEDVLDIACQNAIEFIIEEGIYEDDPRDYDQE